MARNGHKSTPSLVRTPRCDADSFVTMLHASTSGRRPLVRTLAVTESEHPASATTRHLVHNAESASVARAAWCAADRAQNVLFWPMFQMVTGCSGAAALLLDWFLELARPPPGVLRQRAAAEMIGLARLTGGCFRALAACQVRR